MQTKTAHIIFIFFVFGISLSKAQQTISESDKLKFQEHFFDALAQKAINQPKKAIENLEVCYAIDSANTAVNFELSKNYLQLKKYFNAIAFVNKALYTKPSNLFLQQHKVAILKAQNNLEEAIKIQKKIVKTHPVHSDGLVLLYIQNKEYDKAKDLVTKTENKGLTTSKLASYKRYLKSIFSSKNKQEKQAKEVANNNSLEAMRTAFLKTKKFTTLIKLLEKEVALNNFDLLLKDTKNGLTFFPAQPVLYKMQGIAYNKLNKPKKAIEALTLGIDFVIDDVTLLSAFYKQLLISYKALNYKAKVVEIEKKLKNLKSTH